MGVSIVQSFFKALRWRKKEYKSRGTMDGREMYGKITEGDKNMNKNFEFGKTLEIIEHFEDIIDHQRKDEIKIKDKVFEIEKPIMEIAELTGELNQQKILDRCQIIIRLLDEIIGCKY